jgi:hypothetical protein
MTRPDGTAANADLVRGLGLNGDRLCACREQPDERKEDDEQRKSNRPGRGLRLQRQERFDDDRIGEQRGKRTKIGCGVEHIRIARLLVSASGKPALQQWGAG